MEEWQGVPEGTEIHGVPEGTETQGVPEGTGTNESNPSFPSAKQPDDSDLARLNASAGILSPGVSPSGVSSSDDSPSGGSLLGGSLSGVESDRLEEGFQEEGPQEQGDQQLQDQHEDSTDDLLDHLNAELSGRSRKPSTAIKPRNYLGKPREAVGWTIDQLPDPPDGFAEEKLGASLRNQLRLSLIPGVGPRILQALLDRFETAGDVFAASTESLASVPGVGPKLSSQIKMAPQGRSIDQIVQWCEFHQTDIVASDDPRYPLPLLDLTNPPPILFVRGQYVPSDQLAVSIVGTRHATSYGLAQARRLAHGLAQAGICVVSGLARGIDAAAHDGALTGNGRTIAVLGGGMAKMYPPENTGLAKAIVADGAVMTEHPPMTQARSSHFPQRNRLVAALSLGTLVIEAADRSGSQITARLAGELNRDVMAIPGSLQSRMSRGCHELIRDGATLVRHVDDILELIGPLGRTVPDASGQPLRNPAELQLNEVERKILAAIDSSNVAVDVVIEQTELPAHQVIATISVLEMRKLIRRHGGNFVCRI